MYRYIISNPKQNTKNIDTNHQNVNYGIGKTNKLHYDLLY